MEVRKPPEKVGAMKRETFEELQAMLHEGKSNA